jgi:hypothetical protein
MKKNVMVLEYIFDSIDNRVKNRFLRKILTFFVKLTIVLLLASVWFYCGLLRKESIEKATQEATIRKLYESYSGKIVIIDSILDRSGTGAGVYDPNHSDRLGLELTPTVWHGWRLGDSVYKPPRSRFVKIMEKEPDTTYWFELYPEIVFYNICADGYRIDTSNFFVPENYVK